MMQNFVGTWRLKSFELRSSDGQVSYPFGQDAKGYLLYAQDGYMSVAFMRADRPNYISSDPMAGSLEEKAGAADSFYGYCGRYEFEGDTVTHHIGVSFFPNWCGIDQVRLYHFDGDHLTLSTPPFLVSGIQQTAHLIWEKARVEQTDSLPLLSAMFMRTLDLS